MGPADDVRSTTGETVFAAPGDLARVREFVRDQAAAAGLTMRRAELLALAVNELMANTLEHTGGTGVVRVWTDTGAVVCEVEDRQPRGARRTGAPVMPVAEAPRGRGLAIVAQVCDEVSFAAGGTVVRVRMSR
ncbi:hypothetical protein Cs7R123_43880 [Catellatospora sp. TT07R-123]|uniref:ATP-binding protein n=1 Tax=Catellatospora sp. TT07R-123 TaxID=2733863 RepID=UPI001B2A1BF6|nr:ATP-binding protein [Catellatospora sp. TT07R-123]GHJ47046.1 hypothetical protein Cs7R123_43880 [Catellatospora sp. TT07R-123]